MKWSKILKTSWPEILFTLAALAFSRWLMWHTFDYQDGFIYIAPKAWSDFSAHIPLIRSFSWGKNWPPEYPLFPGEPIRYHFGFYLLVGWLEKIGLPLDWALNLPSLLSFAAMLIIVYLLGKLLFKKRAPAFLAVIFLLFNGSWSFLEFFKLYPLSWQTPQVIFKNNVFPSFGPYDGKIVSAFWNLNIYTNQRHLALAYFCLLLIIYLLLKKIRYQNKLNWGQILPITLILSLLPVLHKGVLIMAAVILASFFVYFPKLRRTLLVIGVTTTLLIFPQLFNQLGSSASGIAFRPGYLIPPPLTTAKFANYWFLNLGLSTMFIPLGFFLANQTAKKLFLSILPLFAIANLFQFSPEIAANSKFINLFLIIGNILSAWAIDRIFTKKIWGKFLAIPLIFLMIFSGIIDFFPIKNDRLGGIADAPKNPDVAWIKNHTPPDAVFLNSSYIFNPASLAGRKIFLGWPYFPWSMGYNLAKREKAFRSIYESQNKKDICRMLKENKLDYFTIENIGSSRDLPSINYIFFQRNFTPSYSSSSTDIQIFEVNKNCS